MSGPISMRLGLTLYELLAARPAFEAEDRHALIRQVTQGEPRHLRQVEPTDSPRPGDDRPHGHRQGPQRPLRHGRGSSRRARAVPGRPADPLAAGLAAGAVLAVVQAQSLAGAGHLGGLRADDRDRGRLDGGRLPQWPARRPAQGPARRGQPQPDPRLHERGRSPPARPARGPAVRGTRRDRPSHAAGPVHRLDRAGSLPASEPGHRRHGPARHAGLVGNRDRRSQRITASPSTASFERYAFKRDDGTIVVRRIGDDRTLLELPGLHRKPQ